MNIPAAPDNEPRSIESHFAKHQRLDPYADEFFIPHVADGEDVVVGWGMAIRCNFLDFAEQVKALMPTKQELEESFQSAGKLERLVPDLNEDMRRFMHTCWTAAKIAKKLMGNRSTDKGKRNVRLSDPRVTTKSGNMVFSVTPLSECINDAVCAEYAIMTHHVLEKFGIQSSIIEGAVENFGSNGEDAHPHTFLTLADGNYVFDPSHAVQEGSGESPRILIPEVPFTVDTLKDFDQQSHGKKFKCVDLVRKTTRRYGSRAGNFQARDAE